MVSTSRRHTALACLWALFLAAGPSCSGPLLPTPDGRVPDAGNAIGGDPDAGTDLLDAGTDEPDAGSPPGPGRSTRTVEANGVSVDVILDIPANDVVDVLLVYHGTVVDDDRILQAAQDTLDAFRAILERDDMLVVSVAYPEEGLLMGDNVAHAEAALLWVRQQAAEALGITVGKVFLAGHSQGGYLVTRLNTLHAVDGVLSNAPGPLDLGFRCQLEEDGRIPESVTCTQLAATYGSTTQNPDAYAARSLLTFTSGHRSDIVFFQGLNDSPIQMRSWPLFKEQMEACTDCQDRRFVELPGFEHGALFASAEAQRVFNEMLRGP